MSFFQEKYQEYLNFFENSLTKYCESMDFTPSILTESMRYSLLSGGKRVRPVLFFAALDLLGVDYTKEINLAIALECVHTYSLIHDDLPAMDNDDFRRGKPSNHKKFGEANAILAGDGLLSLACSILLDECKKGNRYLLASQTLSKAMGASGMIAGQSADLYYTGKNAGERELLFIYENKTAKLIMTPLVMAGCIAQKYQTELKEFGTKLGVLFQITDDILDEKGESSKMGKTLGKDAQADKFTCVKVFGLEKSEELADKYRNECLDVLSQMDNFEFFAEMVEFIRSRDI